jgi:hypothetical protein
MVKRSVRGTHVKTRRPVYAADFLPDVRLKQYESEPPGIIHALGPGLELCYIKQAKQKLVNRMIVGATGPVPVQVSTTIYVWERV